MSEGTKRNISVVKDADGNKIVVINDILFKGKRSVNWNDVKEYLKACIGKVYSIVETCDSIYVGKDLPDEYTGSEYTESLRGTNAKAKANASQGTLKDMKMLLGLTAPTDGEFQIDNMTFPNDRVRILKEVGSFIESPSFYPNLTGRENLDIIRRILELPASSVDKALELVGLSEFGNRLAKNIL